MEYTLDHLPPLKQSDLRHVVDVIRSSLEEAFAYLCGGGDLRDGSSATLTSPTGRTSAFRQPSYVRCWRLTTIESATLGARPPVMSRFLPSRKLQAECAYSLSD